MKTITTDNNAETSIFNETDLTEINRRVDMIKQRLIGDLLSASGNPLTLNGVFNYLSVLIQLPIMVLLYEKKKGEYHYTEHFDFEKTKASRGSLALEVHGADGTLEDFDPTKVPVLDESTRLFPVFDTGFFIKVFLLEVGKNDETPFTELSSLKKRPTQKVTNFEIQQEYARLCISLGFSFAREQDTLRYGEPFLADVNGKIKDIFSGHVYAKPTDDKKKERRIQTLVKSEEADEIKRFVEERNKDIKGNWHSLDRLYRRAREASLAIKKIGKDSPSVEDQNIPNLLFFLRAYDRENPRAERAVKSDKLFSGYAHNVSFLIPEKQQDEIRSCFEYLRIQSNKGRPYLGERYGEGWRFKNIGYDNFANSLDAEFWSILMTHTTKLDGIQTLLDILNKPIGTQTTSMVDAVFYYGTSMYRLPFRRDGGLGRLYALTSFYERLSEKEKQQFTFNDLDREKDAELRNDCLRVVVFFYISRMLAPFCKDQNKKWTKVHLFPIDVAGAVVGSVGSITYEEKADTSIESFSLETVKLPIETMTWNQDFYFFVEIFSAVQRALRQQFRDFQINQLCNVVSEELNRLIESAEANADGFISKDVLQNFADKMNAQSKKIARICPYPAYVFNIIETKTLFDRKGDMYTDTVPMGSALGLKFQRDQSFDVFRPLYKTTTLESKDTQLKGDRSMENILKENAQSLKTKLHERVNLTLETYAKFKNLANASNGETND
jgi:hypothetical protein